MAKSGNAVIAPKPDPLFGYEPGAIGNEVIVVPWQVLETRRPRTGIPAVGELASRQLVELGNHDNRDRFLHKFKGKWVPFHEQEVTFALRTLKVEVGIAAKGGASPAVKRVIGEVENYLHEAGVAVETLDEALISPEDTEPLPDAVRNNQVVRTELAKFLLAKNYFDLFVWHPRKRSPREPNRKNEAILQKIDDQLGNREILGDKELVSLWKQARNSQKARQIYWSNQYTEVRNIDIVRGARR